MLIKTSVSLVIDMCIISVTVSPNALILYYKVTNCLWEITSHSCQLSITNNTKEKKIMRLYVFTYMYSWHATLNEKIYCLIIYAFRLNNLVYNWTSKPQFLYRFVSIQRQRENVCVWKREGCSQFLISIWDITTLWQHVVFVWGKQGYCADLIQHFACVKETGCRVTFLI